MEKSIKYMIVGIIFACILILLPNISKGAETNIYKDTAQGIEWEYELDKDNNVINLKCKTKGVTGAVTIPSTIDGKTVITMSRSEL